MNDIDEKLRALRCAISMHATEEIVKNQNLIRQNAINYIKAYCPEAKIALDQYQDQDWLATLVEYINNTEAQLSQKDEQIKGLKEGLEKALCDLKDINGATIEEMSPCYEPLISEWAAMAINKAEKALEEFGGKDDKLG